MRKKKAGNPREFTIDALAREAGTTVRNVRAYQERGLLPPPVRRGRVGIYDDTHMARLRIVARLLERGYSLANVAELIEAWESGHDIPKLLGLESALASPWTDEAPQTVTMDELRTMFGDTLTPGATMRALEMGVIAVDGDRVTVPSMKLLRAGALLAREGVPLDDLLKIIETMRTGVTRAADSLVRLVERYVFDRYGKNNLPPAQEAPRLAELLLQLRPLTVQALDSEVARAMENASDKILGDRLSKVLTHLNKDKGRGRKSGKR